MRFSNLRANCLLYAYVDILLNTLNTMPKDTTKEHSGLFSHKNAKKRSFEYNFFSFFALSKTRIKPRSTDLKWKLYCESLNSHQYEGISKILDKAKVNSKCGSTCVVCTKARRKFLLYALICSWVNSRAKAKDWF